MIRVAVLTISDSAANGTRDDKSGPALVDHCGKQGWQVVAAEILPDEVDRIASAIRLLSDNGEASLVLTTGGTGVAHRDVTPEATRSVIEREIPGFGELMRMKGLEQTRYSVLSRGLAGTRNRTLIVNLPGSTRGAVESLRAVEPLVTHVIDLLEGKTEHAEGMRN